MNNNNKQIDRQCWQNELVTITVEMTRLQAGALHQYLTRVTVDDYRRHMSSLFAAEVAQAGGEQLRRAFSMRA